MNIRFFQINWWKQFLTSQKLALILTGTTIVLAVWGFTIDRGVGDSIYNTIRLFNVDMDKVDHSLPWQVQAARFLAPIALAYTFLVALATVLRTQLQGFRVRHFYSDHVVLIGLGKSESQVARHLRDDDEGFRIVGLEVDETSAAIAGLRGSGVPVVVGDARDPEILTRVRPEKALHVIVFTGDDSTNLEVVAALSRQLPESSDTTVHVIIDSPFLWTSLHRFQFNRDTKNMRIEFICLPDRAAGLLVDAAEAEERLDGADPTQHVAVAGGGAIAARLVVQLVRSPAFDELRRIEVLASNPEESEACRRILQETDPWVLELDQIQIDFVESVDYPSAEFTLGFIVGLSEADTLGEVLKMRGHATSGVRIFGAVPDQDIAKAVREVGLDFNRTEFVPVGELVEGSHLMHGSAHELIARGRHKVYVRERIAAGESPDENASLVSWEELPAPLRKSNRDFADSVAEKLSAVGAELVPLEGNDPPELELSPEELEQLAKDEHVRWCRDLTNAGWRPTDGPKDPDQKLHPLLVPWEELSEAERQKDRESILALPEIFASVGFSMRPG